MTLIQVRLATGALLASMANNGVWQSCFPFTVIWWGLVSFFLDSFLIPQLWATSIMIVIIMRSLLFIIHVIIVKWNCNKASYACFANYIYQIQIVELLFNNSFILLDTNGNYNNYRQTSWCQATPGKGDGLGKKETGLASLRNIL